MAEITLGWRLTWLALKTGFGTHPSGASIALAARPLPLERSVQPYRTSTQHLQAERRADCHPRQQNLDESGRTPGQQHRTLISPRLRKRGQPDWPVSTPWLAAPAFRTTPTPRARRDDGVQGRRARPRRRPAALRRSGSLLPGPGLHVREGRGPRGRLRRLCERARGRIRQ